MNAMKRAVVFSAILLLASSAAFAESSSPSRFSNRLFNDVVEMTRAGLSNDTIVAYVKARHARLDADVSAEDLIRLRQAGVHETVVRYIAGASGIEGPGAASREESYESSGETTQPVEPSEEEDVAVGYPYPYAYGYPYWYGWLGYPYWYGYGPYFSNTFFVGGRFGHGRHFIGRGGFHGGGRGGFHGGGRGGFRGGGHGGRGRR